MSNLSQAEIWDDSTLVDSWNDALQEYDRYHSMHARGEKVEEVLKTQSLNNESPSFAALADEKTEVTGQVLEGDEVDMEPRQEVAVEELSVEIPPSKTEATTSTQLPSSQAAPALPQHLVGQVHDEALKNLLMSWYYAGYYTGLYEGQKQAKKD